MQKVIAIIVVVAVLAVGGVLASSHKKTPAPAATNNSATNSTSTNSNTQSSQNSESTAANTITYSSSGFSPKTLTVKAGDKVTIKNTSSNTIQFDSNPHPIHTDDEDLNAGVVEAGQSTSFTANKTGTFGYHYRPIKAPLLGID
jgi:plastocyanin